MVWSLRATSSLSMASRADSRPAKPTGTAADDLIVAVMYDEGDTPIAFTSPTTGPPGFTALRNGENVSSSPDANYRAWYRIADGGANDTITPTHGNVYCGWAVASFTPTRTPAALNVESAAAQTANATTLNLTAITTTKPDCIIIAGAVDFYEHNFTTPTGYAEAVECSPGGAAIFWVEQAAPASTGTVSVTWAAGTSAAVGALHAFQPADAAAAPYVRPVNFIYTHTRM